MEHWAQKCDGAGVDPAEHSKVCKERDELKAALDGAKIGMKALNDKLVEIAAERDALLEIVRKSVEACDYCKNIGAVCPCFDMYPPPDCDECTLEKSICCKCRAGSLFEFVGVNKEETE